MISLIFVAILATSSVTVSGFPNPAGRIVGGHNTVIEAHPYQAGLLRWYSPTYNFLFCGASIISTKYLLTAAHCKPPSLELVYARVGSALSHEGGQLLKVELFLTHPQFVMRNLDYDFAIVGFGKGAEIVLGPKVQIIKLFPAHTIDPRVNSLVTVTGWGQVNDYIPGSEVLRAVDLPVFSPQLCPMYSTFWTPRHLCLGGTAEGSLSACYGDSGGPAVQNGIQIALVSGGDDCFKPGIPGMYSKVSLARPWLNATIGI